MVLNDSMQHNMVSVLNIIAFVSFPLLFVSRIGLVTTSPCPPYICLQLQSSYGIHTCHLHGLNTTMKGATLTTTYVENMQPLYLCLGDCGWTRVHSPHL
jgi:hypothetical protein